MQIISDLHLHSRFSRAVSAEMSLPQLTNWAVKKGIGLLGTGDFTHPIWYREILSQLTEVETGIYEIKSEDSLNSKPKFLLTTELSCIYSQGNQTRRIHLLVVAPNVSAVARISSALTARHINLLSDGRPILGLTARDLTRLILEADENCLVIPAHIWTPWFSLYGAMSGFDSLTECFGDLSGHITAVETGLSSDPAMNWKIEELTKRNIVSFGDAHSPAKLGREATVFELPELNFMNIKKALGYPLPNTSDSYIKQTIEFYPEEGKYHYSGHRNCNIVYSPTQMKKLGSRCPVCGRSLTIGVASRVEQLATKEIEIQIDTDNFNVKWNKEKGGDHAPYTMLVPLTEILAEALDSTVSSKKTLELFNLLTTALGGEFKILLQTDLKEVEKVAGTKVAEGIAKVRKGDIHIEPGYDGVFGKVSLWQADIADTGVKQTIDQETLF